MDIKNSLEKMLIINRKQEVATLYTDIEYEIHFENNLQSDMYNLTIPIVIPDGTKYVENNLYINGEIFILNDSKAFRILTFEINRTIDISYKVSVQSIPQNGAISNRITLTYLDNIDNGIINEIMSNRVSTNVKGAKLEIYKELNNDNLYINEKIVQDVVVVNNGNVRATNVVIEEIVPKNIIIESALVDENKLIDSSDFKNIPIGSLEALQNVKIRWYGKIVGVNNENEYLETKVIYSYFDDYTNSYLHNNESESKILMNVKQGYLSVKSNEENPLVLDKEKALINEDVQMKFSVYNIGNVKVENLKVKLDITAGTYIKELSINGNFFSRENIDNLNEIYLKEIEVNEELKIKGRFVANNLEVEDKKIKIIVKYKYFDEKRNSFVECIYKSNEVKLNSYGVVLESLSGGLVKKECNKTVCKVGDICNYKIKVKNNGNINCDKLILREDYNPSSEFIDGSLKINNKPIIKSDIYKGVFLGNLSVGEEIYIDYNMKSASCLGCDWLISTSFLEYKEETSNSVNIDRSINVTYKNTRIINSMLVEKTDENKIENYRKQDIIPYNIELENCGNIDIDDLEIHFNKSKDLVFREISINGENIDLKTILDNIIHIKSINYIAKKKTLKLEMKLAISENSIGENVKIDGKLLYSHIKVDGIDKENTILNLQTKTYKITNGDFKGRIIAKKKGTTKGPEMDIEAEIVIDNIGNADLYDVEIIPHKGNTIDLINRESINKDHIPSKIECNEKIVIPIKFKANEDYMGSLFKFSSDLKARYKFKEEDIEINRGVDEIQIELVDECVKCDISSNKNSFIIGDKAYFNINISNMGSHSLNNVIFQINIPKEVEILEDKIFIRDTSYRKEEIINGVNIGDIDIDDSISIKYSTIINKVGLNNEVSTYYKIEGYYNIDISNERIYKEYSSEILKSKTEQVSAKVFLTTDKYLLLNGEDIKFTATIINDGTIPIDINYRLDIGEELEEITDLRTLNGDNEIDFNDILKVEPNDGIVIEKTYVYKKFRGMSNIFPQGIINVNYKMLDNKYNGCKEIKTEKLEIEITNTSFRELIIEEVIDIKKIEPIIDKIINIYITPTITSQNVRTVKRDYEYKSSDITGYRLEFVGKMDYTIEYVSKDNSEGVHLISKDIIFASNIMLPEDFILGEDVKIKPKVLSVSHKIIREGILFININLLINTSI